MKLGDPQFDHVDTAICIWEWVEFDSQQGQWDAIRKWLTGTPEASIADTRCSVVGLALAVSNAYRAVGTDSNLPWDDQFVWPLCRELMARGITGFYGLLSGDLIDKTKEVTEVAAECVPRWSAEFWGE